MSKHLYDDLHGGWLQQILDTNCPYLSSPPIHCDNELHWTISPFAYNNSFGESYRSDPGVWRSKVKAFEVICLYSILFVTSRNNRITSPI